MAEEDLLPRSKGKYAIGADAFMKKLDDRGDARHPARQAAGHRRGEPEARPGGVRRHREARSTRRKTPAEVLARSPTTTRSRTTWSPRPAATIERTRKFLIDKKIVTVPSEVRPTIAGDAAVHAHRRLRLDGHAGGLRDQGDRGVLLRHAAGEGLGARSGRPSTCGSSTGPAMDIITIHEAFPGHYIQFLYAKQYPTKMRKLYTCGTNVEGWAHYCEQMMRRGGLRRRRPEGPAGPAHRGPAARLPVRRRDQAAHGRVDGGAGARSSSSSEGFLEPEVGVRGGPPRDVQPDVPLLHAGQAADLQAARGLPEGEGARTSSCRRSTTSSSARAACRSS